MKNMIVIVLLSLAMFSCTGDDPVSPDTTAPAEPVLIPHLGDPGIDQNGLPETVVYNGSERILSESNNGIDAVPEGDWIRLEWENIIDTDIDYINVYRFNQYDISGSNVNLHLIDSVSFSYQNQDLEYVDETLDDYTGTGGVFDNEWFYKIELVDLSGNKSISDSVSYTLLEKALPIYPQENQIVSSTETLELKWQNGAVNGVINKAMLYDENMALIWNKRSLTPAEIQTMICEFPLESGKEYYWRIDSFATSENAGSESQYVKFTVE